MRQSFLISRVRQAEDLPLPAYMSEGAAGMDLYANLKVDCTIKTGEIVTVPVGIKLALPVGYEAQIRPRSGLARHYGITMVNSPGTIDADYRGEIQVILINHGSEDFVITRGMRVGQMVISKIERIIFVEVAEEALPDSARGSGGFGHTGIL